VVVLEWFETVTNEFQSNRVSAKLSDTVSMLYTVELCEVLLASLEKRFPNVMDNELYVVSSFLDPNFGLDLFPPQKKLFVKKKVLRLLTAVQQSQTKSTSSCPKKHNRIEAIRNQFYIFHKSESNDQQEQHEVEDQLETNLDKFISVMGHNDGQDIDALEFWKKHE
jgi:hypothetical protein